MSFITDPIMNVIDYGFKRDISLLIENKCYRGALILIYTTIDAITFSASPKQKIDRNDFINWCNSYLNIIGIIKNKEPYRLNGVDLYGARCSIVHTYGHMLESDISKQGKCCIIGYMNGRIKQDCKSNILTLDNSKGSILVMVSVLDLADALFAGINAFMIDLYSDKLKNKDNIQIFESKVQEYLHESSIDDLNP